MHPPTLSLAARSPDLEDLIEKARAYIHAAKSPATLRAYRTDFEDFTRFCEVHNLPYLPATPTTVALYIADRAGSLRSATITRRLTSITKAHQAAGFAESPSSSHHFVVSETLKGIRRTIGTAQAGKAPLLTSDIRRIVACCPETLSGLRDRALVLVGYAGAFRRSKTDQEAAGRKVGIPIGKEEKTCPVQALRCWLAASGISSGAVLRGVNRVGKISRRGLHKDCVGWILKRAASRAGLKPEPLGGHSLRAGCVRRRHVPWRSDNSNL
ncbi:MAG TPA: site-specific integrase [Edaphobacter sp.]|uniref:site-specific integrase n=1 Tax=Edaphobacter sp. TaxID=1934404 RepID=UPI002B56AF19|nr:site-specific integrase [Edaphobacter sp.]HUZ97206.1 site-specific integrase [Edaphobacter sp.]